MGMRLCIKEKETDDIFEVSVEWVPTNTIP